MGHEEGLGIGYDAVVLEIRAMFHLATVIRHILIQKYRRIYFYQLSNKYSYAHNAVYINSSTSRFETL